MRKRQRGPCSVNRSTARQQARLSGTVRNRRPSRCELRGYCGPFANEEFYDAFPEPLWHGMADCLECGTTCHVALERERCELATRSRIA